MLSGKHLLFWAAALLIAALACTACKKAPPAGKEGEKAVGGDDEIVLALVHTNDVHGYILPVRAFWRIDMEKPEGYAVDIGGVEWFAGYMNIVRQEFGERVILVDGGDMFQGTMISNRSEGSTVIAAMNHLRYDAAALGNHEFDFGPVGEKEDEKLDPFGAIKARGKQAGFPILAANLYDRGTGKVIDWEGFSPYVIVDVAGVKVGIVGGPTVDTPTISKGRVKKNLDFRPLAEAIKLFAPKMREEGAQIIIGLLHAGGGCKETDDPNDISTCDAASELFETANQLEPGTVDILVGAHTHRILNHYVNGIPVVEAGANGKLFGLVKLHFSKKEGRVTKVDLQRPVGVCHYFFENHGGCIFLEEIPGNKTLPATFLGRTVERVEFLDGLFDKSQKKVLEEAREKLGPTAVKDIARSNPGEDHPMGLLLTHVLLEKYPEADMAIFNESGLRANIMAGEITMEDVFQVLPFDSGPAFIKLSGRRLSDLLRLASSGAHGLPVVRGLRLEIDRTRDECIQEDWNGNGIKEKWERNLLVSATLEDGSPIVPDKEYTIVTSSYLATGGSDFARIFSKRESWKPSDFVPVRELIVDWMRKHPIELGGKEDHFTKAKNGPLVKVHHRDHEINCPGTGE